MIAEISPDFHDNTDFLQKFRQIFEKIIKNVFSLKNIFRILEFFLLIIFNIFYGKKPLINWDGFKFD
jgi:hypothetical protein